MSTAVRFVISGPTNVDFTHEEIEDTLVIPMLETETQKSQTRVPRVVTYGSEWKRIEMSIKHWKASTQGKIEQLLDEEDEMTCYYAYRDFTTTKSLSVILDPSERTEIYVYGDKKAKWITQLNFLQSS